MAPHSHAVTFYDLDREVVDDVATFVAGGIDQQGRALVVATSRHRPAIETALVARGLDPHAAKLAGRLVILDARKTLRSFMTRNGPDRDLFLAHVGRRVLNAGSDGAPVRVFGEMVGLLWEAGNVRAAIELEAMWSGLVDRLGFDLLCAYPASLVDASGLAAVHGVCGQHSVVHAPASYATHAGDRAKLSRVFLPVPEAVSSSRRFVIASLRRLGADHLVQDAAVIVSELATNAVLHAQSPFRVSVDEAVGVVCLSVQDVGDGQAAARVGKPDEHAIDGRGIAIIEALSRRWGCDTLSDGKVVWVELAA